MSLITPSKIRDLQSKLYRKAKNETTCFSRDTAYGRLGVFQLRRVRMESRS